MFDAYCLFIYFLFIYFLCCKYRPFFPIFFYIIPTKICKILFFCKNPLFPSFFRSFVSLSSSLFSLFCPFILPPFVLFFCPLYPGCWVRVGFGAARLHRFPFPSYKQKACRHHPHSDAPTGFSHTFISGIAIVILFLYFNHFFISS